MRSRIITAPTRCVAVNIDEEKAATLKKLLEEYKAELFIADKNCGGQKIGWLCGFNGFSESDKKEECSEQLMIFSGFRNNVLSGLVGEMRECGCSVDLKAVATPHNQRWTVNELAEHLHKEHEAMHGINNKN